MKIMMNKITIACLLLVAIILAIWLQDVISDRHHELKIMHPIILLEKAPQDYPNNNRGIGIIQAGEKVKVLRMSYGKDFRAWKVQGSTGQEGWFIEEQGNIEVKK